mgnify:CR=1 FL=1
MTWQEFKAGVRELLTVDSDRLNIQTFIDRQIRNAAVDIQSNIQFYRKDQQVTYSLNGSIKDSEPLADEEKASVGFLEGDMRITDAYLIDASEDFDWADDLSDSADDNSACASIPLTQYPWSSRYDMICGAAQGLKLISISPKGGDFYVFPKIDSTDKVEIFYDGIKSTFADADVLTFDEPVIEIVADFVKAKISREVDHDLPLHDSYWQSFVKGRSRLYLDARDRVTVKYSLGSKLPKLAGGTCNTSTDDSTAGCQGTTYSTTI